MSHNTCHTPVQYHTSSASDLPNLTLVKLHTCPNTPSQQCPILQNVLHLLLHLLKGVQVLRRRSWRCSFSFLFVFFLAFFLLSVSCAFLCFTFWCRILLLFLISFVLFFFLTRCQNVSLFLCSFRNLFLLPPFLSSSSSVSVFLSCVIFPISSSLFLVLGRVYSCPYFFFQLHLLYSFLILFHYSCLNFI